MTGFRDEHFESADDLIQAFLPSGATWGGRLTGWVFRGQQNSDWALVPTAYRADGNLGPTTLKSQEHSTRGAQRQAEVLALAKFSRLADSQGLSLPRDTQSFREKWLGPLSPKVRPLAGEINELIGGPNEPWAWPDSEILPLLGLARHYGVAARLLDWSKNPLVACYFAGTSAAKRVVDHGEDGELAVWALHAGRLQTLKSELEIVTVPYANNPNLRLQEGVFTLLREARWLPDHPVDRRGLEERLFEVPSIQRILSEVEEEGGDPSTMVLQKLTLPWSEAPKLLDRLNCLRVSAARVYEGYEGPARALEEQRLRSYWVDAHATLSEHQDHT